MKKVSMILVVLIAVFLVIGCAGYQQSDNEAEENGEAVETTNVIMEDIQFKPATIQVSVGDTVTWTNEDSATHTVTGQDFDSGNMDQGENFTYTFDETGTYDYECTIHPSMTGTVIVGENVTDSDTEDDENTGGY